MRVVHLESIAKTERRRREELESALMMEKERAERLDAENMQLDSGYQTIVRVWLS